MQLLARVLINSTGGASMYLAMNMKCPRRLKSKVEKSIVLHYISTTSTNKLSVILVRLDGTRAQAQPTVQALT